MLLDEHRHRPLFRLLSSIFIPPANADSEFPVATAFYAEIVGSKEVIES
jgi:hypothetical protein